MSYSDPLCVKCGHPKSNHPYRHAFVSSQEMSLEERIKELEEEIEKLRKALDVYQRERDRFKHTYPEITGAFFLTGGHGERDSNELPEYVRICPAYGCAWDQVYKKTDETFSYEGS